jgi:hypothetical protein
MSLTHISLKPLAQLNCEVNLFIEDERIGIVCLLEVHGFGNGVSLCHGSDFPSTLFEQCRTTVRRRPIRILLMDLEHFCIESSDDMSSD